MRRGPADFFEARSASGCTKAGYRAATEPVSPSTTMTSQSGGVHIVRDGSPSGARRRYPGDSTRSATARPRAAGRRPRITEPASLHPVITPHFTLHSTRPPWQRRRVISGRRPEGLTMPPTKPTGRAPWTRTPPTRADPSRCTGTSRTCTRAWSKRSTATAPTRNWTTASSPRNR